jgi:beta-lactamase regulating signal transducer with metallopeptidase domain
MENIMYNISQVFGITIIHSLWQGMLVYFILRIVFAAAPSLTSVKKYNLGIFAMLSVTTCFFYTLFTEIYSYNWVILKPLQPAQLLPSFNLPLSQHVKPGFYTQISGFMPYICAVYFAGLLANVAKLGWEWNKIRLIKRSFIPAEQMQQFINSFSKKLGITQHIHLKFSELIDVPCMIGFFKPLILLPVSLSLHLSACEVEAILLHELSHIKRNDYVVNLLQQAVSVILFFNPFTHLINRVINRERENSCDDLVVEKTGKPLIYAKALLKLEEARAHDLQLALAITGKKFHLLNRIERIMKTQKQIGNMRHLLIAILLFTGAIGCMAWLNPTYAKAIGAKASKLTPAMPPAATDTNQYVQVSDTVKHKLKGKKMVSSKTGLKKHTGKTTIINHGAWSNDTTFSDSLAWFYNTPEWKSRMEAIRKQGEELRKKFDSPEWKEQVLAMQKQGEEMKKKFDSPEWKQQMENIKKQGEEMKKKFNSPEWKQQMENMQKQGEEMKKKFDSPEWKEQMENMKKQGEEMKKKFNGPEWKQQMEDIKKQGEEMKKKFNGPEWKQQMEDIKKQGEEMKKKFDSPEWKEQVKNMQKQAEEIKKQFDSPEWKKQMDEWRKQRIDSGWRIQPDYFKKQRHELKKTLKDQKWKLKDTVGGVKVYAPKDSI